MADATLPGLLLTGDHASRPAATAVGSGALYACSTHNLIYQSDAATWSTWSDVSGSGAAAGTAPGWVSDLVGTTTSTAFYWDGDDKASFTEVDITGTTTWTEDDNLISVVVAGMTAEDCNCLLIAQTFATGHAWVVPVLGIMGHTTTQVAVRAGIIFTDGTASSSNCVAGHLQVGETGTNVSTAVLVGRHGTLTAASTAPWVLDDILPPNAPSFLCYIKLTYQAANTFRLEFSPDGVTYHAFGEADISKTMTPTHVGVFVQAAEADGTICTFGPLIKVA